MKLSGQSQPLRPSINVCSWLSIATSIIMNHHVNKKIGNHVGYVETKPPNLQTPWDFAYHEGPTSNLGVMWRRGAMGTTAETSFLRWQMQMPNLPPSEAGTKIRDLRVFSGQFFNPASGVNFYDMTEYTGIYWNYDELDGLGFGDSSHYN